MLNTFLELKKKKKNLACNKTSVNKNEKIIMVENQALKTNLINKRSGGV